MSNDIELLELTHEEWSHGEVVHRFEYMEVEPVKAALADKDAQIKKLTEALGDVIEGESKYDLVCSTGLSLPRCDEIIQLLAEIKG